MVAESNIIMAKYEVYFEQIEKYWFEVEADSEEEAKEKAEEISQSEKIKDYHDDSDAKLEVYEC